MQRTIPNRAINLYCPLFIMVYNLAGNLSNDIYLPSLPAISDYFYTSNFLVQITMTAWFLGVATPQFLFGLLADKYGRKPLMIWGGIVFIVSSFVCAFSPNIYLLIVGRFFQGVGVSSLNNATYATVNSRYYDEKKSIKLLSYLNITGSLAPLLGPVIGSYIYQFFGWRANFMFITLLSSIAILGLYFTMFESYESENRKNLILTIKNVWRYYRPIFMYRKIWPPLFCQSALLGSLIAYLTTAPFVMRNIYHVHIKDFGLTQIIPFTFFILGGFINTKIIYSIPVKKIIQIGFICMLSSLIFLNTIFLVIVKYQLIFYLLAIALYLFGFSLISSPLVSEAMSFTTLKGLSAAILSMAMAVMGSFGSLASAIFFDNTIHSAIIIISAFGTSGIVTYLWLKK